MRTAGEGVLACDGALVHRQGERLRRQDGAAHGAVQGWGQA